MRAVIFDLDGTLQTLEVDFAALRADIDTVFAPFGFQLPRGPLLEVVDQALVIMRNNGTAPEAVERARSSSRELIERAEMESLPRSRILPGVPEALAELERKGFKLALLSRACRRYVDASAEKLGVRFHAIASRDDVPCYKPDPMPVLFLFQSLAVRAEECALVGDHPFDMLAGRRAGARCAGVLTGYGSREQLLEAGAEVVFEGIGEELIRWLESGSAQCSHIGSCLS